MVNLADRLTQVIQAAGVAITGVVMGRYTDKATWKVQPEALQGAAQPIIDAFNPADPAHVTAELDAEVLQALDGQRLISSVLWCMIEVLNPPATIAKYQNVRAKVIAAYKAQPWKP